MNETMRAVICNESGDLVIEDRPLPNYPNDHSVTYALVGIKSFGVNRADLLQRAGHYPAPPGTPQDILGLEFSGVIESFSSGEEHSGTFMIGDRVMGICNGAAYAESIVVPRDQLLAIPDEMSFTQAAALPEAHLTAYDALVNQGQLREGDRVLIHAIGSGVGAAASHIAASMGARVTGTTRSEWKRTRAISDLPVDAVWRSENGIFTPTESSDGFDVILDFIGGAYLRENLKILNTRGRIVVIGLLGGVKGEINLGHLLAKRASLIGTVLRSRSVKEKIDLTSDYRKNILPYLKVNGEISPRENGVKEILVEPVSHVYSALEISLALQHLENGQIWSKVVGEWT